MRTRKQWTSLILVLSILFGLFIGGKQKVWAAGIPNLKLSSDLILSWDPVSGANVYTIQLPFTSTETTKTTFDLGAFMKEKRVASGTIYLSVLAQYRVPGTYNYSFIASQSLTFNYTSPLPALPSPTNVRIEDDRLTWDEVKPENGALVTYELTISDYPDTHTKRFVITRNYVDVLDFAYEGTKTYTINIIAKAEGNQDSVQVSPRVTYTLTLPTLQNVRIEKGFLCWDEFPGANCIELTTRYGGTIGRQANKRFKTYNGTSYIYLADHAKSEKIPVGATAIIQITARREYKNGNTYEQQNISKTASINYTYANEAFPLKFYGQNLTTLNNPFGDKYLPFANVISLSSIYNFNTDFTIPSGAVYNAVFESSQPLTVIGGSGTLIADGPIFAMNSKLTLADCYSLSVRSIKDTAIKADSLYADGQRMTIQSQIDGKDAVVVNNEINFSNSFNSVTVNSVGASALTSKNGKIELNGLSIVTPKKGTLGSDKKHVYLSDGTTVASEIQLSRNTPTPTKKPTNTNTPTPTKKPTNTNTPTPTKKPTNTNTPTPTKKPTNTNTPTPTTKPTNTNTPTPTNTNTPTPTNTPTAIPTPGEPDNVSATAVSGTKVNVSWNAVSGAAGYEVFRSIAENGHYTKLGALTATSRDCPGLVPWTTYYFKVRAYTEVDGTKVYGDFSSVVSAMPIPSAATGLKTKVVSASKVNVSWNEVTGATGYEVYRSTSKEGTYARLGAVTTTNRDCPGLTTGTTYYFKVRAYKEVDGVKVYGPYSAAVSAVPKPTAPVNVKTTVVSATKVNVSWNAVTGATGYEVFRSTSENGTYSKCGAVTTTNRDCPGLTTGTTYYFKVRAYKEVNGTKIYSGYSSIVSVTPKT